MSNEEEKLFVGSVWGLPRGPLKNPAYDYLDRRWYQDPILQLLWYMPQIEVKSFKSSIAVSGTSWRTYVSDDLSLLDGIRTFRSITDQTIGSITRSNWKPRTRFSMYGDLLDITYGGLMPFQELSGTEGSKSEPVGNWDVQTFRWNNQIVIPWEALVFSLRRLIKQTSVIDFDVDASYDNNRRATCTVSIQSLSDDRIRYSCVQSSTSNTHSQKASYSVVVLRRHQLVSYHTYGAIITDVVNSTPHHVLLGSGDFGSVTSTGGDDRYVSRLAGGSSVSINRLKPGLFNTQSVALSKIMGEASRNFESLVESPEMVGFADLLMTETTSRFRGNAFTHVAKLLATGHLIRAFVVEPLLETFADLKKVATKFQELKPMIVVAKDYFTWSSTDQNLDRDKFNGFPEGLAQLIFELCPDPVETVVTYGSQAFTGYSKDDVIKITSSIFYDASRKGFMPQPAYLWQGLTLSFVIDWYLPMSTYIKNAQSALFGTRFTNTTFGHSVFISVLTPRGTKIAVYIRSDATRFAIDPRSASWLRASGAPASIAIPLAIVLSL